MPERRAPSSAEDGARQYPAHSAVARHVSPPSGVGTLQKGSTDSPPIIIIAISLLLGLSLNYVGISPVKALIFSAILCGLTAPVLIAIILHISNNKKVMGNFTNGRISNILGFAALIIMTLAAVALVYLQLTGA